MGKSSGISYCYANLVRIRRDENTILDFIARGETLRTKRYPNSRSVAGRFEQNGKRSKPSIDPAAMTKLREQQGLVKKSSNMKVISEKKFRHRTLRLVQEDITERHVDAIVNAANSRLQHGGGVAGAIVKKGGQIIQQESNKIGHVSVGSSAVTGAGELPCKAIIHAVGPRMGEGDEHNKLKNAINSTLQTAIQHGYRSISIPAISAGIFGFPKDQCAEILVGEARKILMSDHKFSLESVEFCIFDNEALNYFKKEFDQIHDS